LKRRPVPKSELIRRTSTAARIQAMQKENPMPLAGTTGPDGQSCARCKYLSLMRMPPPNIETLTVCRWGPRHLTVIPAQGGMMNLTGYPNIPDPSVDWCWQFKEIESDRGDN
jgi:hypothetical protein